MAIQMQNDLERRLKNKAFAEEYGGNIAKAEIAVTVSQARRSRNLTQEDLAKMLGTNQSYIAKLEGGDANPTIGNIGKILANIGFRLVAGVGTLSSRIEEKGVWSYSANANDITIAWISGAFSAYAVAGNKWTVPSSIVFGDEKVIYTSYGVAVSNPAVSGVSGSGDYFDTIWKAVPEDDSNALIMEGARQ